MATKVARQAQTALAIGGSVIVGLFVLRFFAKEATAAGGGALRTVGTAVNPTNPDNIFSRGVNQLGDLLDDAEDDDSFSVGSFIFDLFNPEFDPNAPLQFAPEVEQTVRGKDDRQRVFVPPAPTNQTAIPNPVIKGSLL